MPGVEATSPPTPPASPDAGPVAPAAAPAASPPSVSAATGPFIPLAVAWISGIALTTLLDRAGWWLALAVLLIAVAILMLRRSTAAGRRWSVLAVIAVAAAWASYRAQHLPANHIQHYLLAEAQLAHLTGVIDSPVSHVTAQRGPMGQFSYEPPGTLFTLAIDTLVIDGAPQPVTGRLLVKIRQINISLHDGDRVEIKGWMQAIDGPSNPGEIDYRPVFADRDVDGRITLNVRGNCRLLAQSTGPPTLAQLKQQCADAAHASLQAGLSRDPQRSAFLDTIMLGRWSRDLGELSESFRKTGLTHVLSISGAHLTMLMGLVWLTVRLIVPRPRLAAIIVLIVLLLYMMAVPWRVPIVRAGLMAGLIVGGLATGRRVRAIDMVALSAVIVLIWRPGDLFNAGAQLSYIVVAGLLIFTNPVSHWLWPDPPVIPVSERFRHAVIRRLVDYISVNLVAFVVAMPLVAYHFQIVSPLAGLLSLAALPVVTILLGVGYLKIMLGLISPSAGMILAGPLEWIADVTTGLVEHASRWPASVIELGSRPSLAWLLGAMAVSLLLLAGWFARRPAAMWLCVAICVLWLLPRQPHAAAAIASLRPQPAMTINMFAVGDGSCFLVRLPGGSTHDPHTLLFDCGSQAYLDVGQRSIVPSLRSLHVTRIDTLIISHADMDHFCGVLDVIKAMRVGRVLVPPQLLSEVEREPASAAALLVRGIEERGVPILPVSRSWRASWGNADADVLWPPADWKTDRANDSSIVLSLTLREASGRRLLFNGDIDKVALPALLATGDDLRADIVDLPHHGSFVPDSPRWFEAVRPSVVMQSSGPVRLVNDKWADIISKSGATRLVTAKLGMVEVSVERDGAIHWSSFRREPEPTEP